jgi:hypothetical protein
LHSNLGENDHQRRLTQNKDPSFVRMSLSHAGFAPGTVPRGESVACSLAWVCSVLGRERYYVGLGAASEHVSEEMLVSEDLSLSNEASGFVESLRHGPAW